MTAGTPREAAPIPSVECVTTILAMIFSLTSDADSFESFGISIFNLADLHIGHIIMSSQFCAVPGKP